MSSEADAIPGAIAIGIGATLVMDLWNLFLKHAFSIPSLNYCLLGRWVRHMPGGTLRHANIAAAPQKPHECTVGWIVHYGTGVMFAIAPQHMKLLTSDPLGVQMIIGALTLQVIGTLIIRKLVNIPY